MNARRFVVASAAAFLMLAGNHLAYAQAHYDFTIPFDFIANERVLAKGHYTLAQNDDRNVLTLTPGNPKTGAVAMPVETRLAECNPLVEPEIVFDKLNGKAYLSELLVPGEDGYLLQVTRIKHTYESLKGAGAKQ